VTLNFPNTTEKLFTLMNFLSSGIWSPQRLSFTTPKWQASEKEDGTLKENNITGGRNLTMLLILSTTIYGIPYLIRYALYLFAVPAMSTECGKVFN
jgi:hypothetical protein